MMWLRRNTKVLDSFYPSKWEINACSMWWGYSMLRFIDFKSYWHDKHEWRPSYTTQMNYGSHTIACIHNTAHVNCCACTYFFRKWLLQFSQHPSKSFFFEFLAYILHPNIRINEIHHLFPIWRISGTSLVNTKVKNRFAF